MKDIKQTLPTLSKEKNLVIIVAIVVMLLFTIAVLYWAFGEKIKEATSQLTKMSASLIKYQKKFDINFSDDILKDTRFINLSKHGQWPVEAEPAGSKNPFASFVKPEPEEEITQEP